MFDIGMTELLLIGIVALIVIGPKDLPGLFHTLGRFTARARSMARDFSRAMEDAARESGVSEVSKDLRSIANPKKMGLDAVKDAASKFENWDPMAASKARDSKAEKKELGPATKALSEERAEAARKIREATAKKAQARIDAEAAAEAGKNAAADDAATEAKGAVPEAAPKPAASKTTATKPKSATKTAASKAKTAKPKSAAKTAAPRKSAGKSKKAAE